MFGFKVTFVRFTKVMLVRFTQVTLVQFTKVLLVCFLIKCRSFLFLQMAIEREEGMGNEVGTSAPGRLMHCPHYMRMYRAFRRVHALIAGGNIVSMTATALHLYNLAIDLCSVV